MGDRVNKLLSASGCPSRAGGTISGAYSINEPRCFAPHVDVTHARLAYGKLALPILERDLRTKKDRNATRQIITSMADLLVNPEEISRAIELRIPERLADLLVSEDPYLREKVAIIYCTMCNRAVGREAILRNPKILHYLSRGLADPLSPVRTKMAQLMETLARNAITAEDLYAYGFIDVLVDRIVRENENAILTVNLECLESLVFLNEKAKIGAIGINTMEKLVSLLRKNEDEIVVAGALSCLAVLCQEPLGEEKSVEMDILPILKILLDDQRGAIRAKAANVIVFVTTTTRGKYRAFELDIAKRLVIFAVESTRDRELQLASIKALSNIAQVPEGRSMLLSAYSMLIEDIDTRGDHATEKHKNILLEIIHWRP